MPPILKRTVFDVLVENYKQPDPQVSILQPGTDYSKLRAQPTYEENFIQRWYVSLQGEDSPSISRMALSQDGKSDQQIYRYDWAFGITVIEGFWWDWMAELPKESSLAVHICLETHDDATEAVPIAATLNALHPSRNTKGIWELAWPFIPRTAAELAKAGAHTLPALEYLSTGLIATSNIIESSTAKQKNWFLYQFVDEHLKCPTVEWRINKEVLAEYGPLIRGTLFVAFYGAYESSPGVVRMLLRPQVRYSQKSDLDFLVPTESLSKNQQVCLEIRPGKQS